MKNSHYNLYDKVFYSIPHSGIYQIKKVLPDNKYVITPFPDELEELTVTDDKLINIPSLEVLVSESMEDDLLEKLDSIVVSEPKVIGDNLFSLQVMEGKQEEAESLLREYQLSYEVHSLH